jgi:hypothetical protein
MSINHSTDPNSLMYSSLQVGPRTRKNITPDAEDGAAKIFGDYVSGSVTYTSSFNASKTIGGNAVFSRDYSTGNIVIGGNGSGIIIRISLGTRTRLELFSPTFFFVLPNALCTITQQGSEVITRFGSCFKDEAGCRAGADGACFAVEGGHSLGPGVNAIFSDGGLFVAASSGVTSLDSGAMITVESTAGAVKIQPNTTFVRLSHSPLAI